MGGDARVIFRKLQLFIFGNSMVNMLPAASDFSKLKRPPWPRINSALMARPRPEPPLVVPPWKAVNRLFFARSGRPGPLSFTLIHQCPCASAALNSICPCPAQPPRPDGHFDIDLKSPDRAAQDRPTAANLRPQSSVNMIVSFTGQLLCLHHIHKQARQVQPLELRRRLLGAPKAQCRFAQVDGPRNRANQFWRQSCNRRVFAGFNAIGKQLRRAQDIASHAIFATAPPNWANRSFCFKAPVNSICMDFIASCASRSSLSRASGAMMLRASSGALA